MSAVEVLKTVTEWERKLVVNGQAEFAAITLLTGPDNISPPEDCMFCHQSMSRTTFPHSMYAAADHSDKTVLIVGTLNMPGYQCDNEACAFVLQPENGDQTRFVTLSTEGTREMKERVGELCAQRGFYNATKNFLHRAGLNQE